MESQHITRVESAFAGEWTDRIGLCEQVIPSSVASVLLGREAFTGSSELLYQEACAWMDGEKAHEEFQERKYLDSLEIHRLLDLDILFLPPGGVARPSARRDEFTFVFGDPDGDDWVVRQFQTDSHQFGVVQQARPPLCMEEVVDVMRDTLRTDPNDAAVVSPMLERAARELSGEFVIAGVSFMSIPMEPGWLEAALLEPELTMEYLDYVVEKNIAMMRNQRELGIRLFNGGGDFAYNSGPIYSPKFFEEVMAPRWKRLFDWCRENDARYIFRSDGNLWPVADSLFGWANPHAYYEIDVDAGMDLKLVRERFPDLVLIGSISCDVLQRGTPEAVQEQTLYCLDAAAPRSIIASANSILHGTPPENIYTMYETVKQYKALTTGRRKETS